MEKTRVWNFIKYLAFVIIVVMAVVLIAQYISLAKLNNKNSSLNNELNTVQQELNDKTQLKDDIEKNYNEFIEDQAKENLGMKDKNEEVIKGKN